MPVFTNEMKKKLKAGRKTAGAWAQLLSPLAAEAMAMQELDWVLIDMEHAPNDFQTLAHQVIAVAGRGVATVVRAPWNDFVAIKRILDTGVQGLLVPYVNTKEEAEEAVRASSYPPQGIRGIAGSHRAAGYGQGVKDYAPYANDEILLLTQIETAEAVKNLDAMLEVERVDGFFIGPMDLATNLGYLANPAHPEVQKTIAEIEEKVLGAGKVLGTVSGSWEAASALYDKGYQFVTLMSDVTTVARTARQLMSNFRERYE